MESGKVMYEEASKKGARPGEQAAGATGSDRRREEGRRHRRGVPR